MEYIEKLEVKEFAKAIARRYCPIDKTKEEYEKFLLGYVDELYIGNVANVVYCQDCNKRWHDGYCHEMKRIMADVDYCSRARRKEKNV